MNELRKFKSFACGALTCLVIEFFVFQPLHNFFLNYNNNSKIENSLLSIFKEYRAKSLLFWLAAICAIAFIVSGEIKHKESKKENLKTLSHLLLCSLSCILIELIFLEPIHEIISHSFCSSHSMLGFHMFKNSGKYYSDKPILFWTLAIFSLAALFFMDYKIENLGKDSSKEHVHGKKDHLIHFIFCALTCFAFEMILFEPIHHFLAHNHQFSCFKEVLSMILSEYSEKSLAFWTVGFVLLGALYFLHEKFNHHNCNHEYIDHFYQKEYDEKKTNAEKFQYLHETNQKNYEDNKTYNPIINFKDFVFYKIEDVYLDFKQSPL